LRAAVTGAAGLLGSNLVRALLAQGIEVRALIHRDRCSLAGLSCELAQADILDPASLQTAFQGVDLVFHSAGAISLRSDAWAHLESTNVHGTRNVINACQANGARMVHISSIHALAQEPFDRPVDENRPLADAPDGPPYDRSKAAGEQVVRQAVARGFDAVIVNPTAIIGPYDTHPSFLGRALIALARQEIPALVKGGFDWVDARDAAAGAIQAGLTAPAGGRYLLSGHWHSVIDLAQTVSQVTGTRPPLVTAPTAVAAFAAPFFNALAHFQHGEPIYTRFTLQALNSNHQIDSSRAAQELGYHPRPFRTTIQETLDWFVQAGMLKPYGKAKHS
jgi:dihydroflavonol-4-reductase